MALDVNKFTRRVRVSEDDPTGNLLEEMTDLFAQATRMVQDYAPNAPTELREAAIVRVGQFLYDSPVAEMGTQNALRSSGASSILARYRSHRLGVSATLSGEAAQAGGLSRDAIVAIIREIVPSWALETDGGSLTSAERAILDKSVQVDSIVLSDRDVTFASDDGTVETITVPGLSVQDDGNTVGAVNSVDEFDFKGSAVSVARIGNKAEITVTGITPGQVSLLIAGNPTIADLRQFEDALRVVSTLANDVAVNVTTPGVAFAVAGAVMPATTSDHEVTVNVSLAGNQVASRTFELASLVAKPRVAAVGGALSASNTETFGDGTRNYYLGIDAARNIIFGSDTNNAYTVNIRDSRIQVSSDQLAPNQRLPAPSAGMFLKWNAGATALENVDEPGGSDGVIVQDEGAQEGSGALGTLNFTGAGVSVSESSGVAIVSVPGTAAGVVVQDEGTQEGTTALATLNFTGAGVGVSESNGVATVNVPGGGSGVAVLDDGTQAGSGPLSSLNFLGAIEASASGNIASITIRMASGSVSGIISAAQFTRIANAVQLDDLHSTPAVAASGIADDDAVLFDDASVSSGSELREIRFDELDKRWIKQSEIPSSRRMPNPVTFTSSDDGTFPAWNNADGAFVNGMFLDANGFTWTYDSTSNQWSVDSDKLTQAQVDARIDAAVPVARRIPSFAVGDAGEYVRVNATGTGLEIVPLGIGTTVTKSNVYEQAKAILQAGHRVTLTLNETTDEITIAVADVPSGNSFPASATVGERFNLLTADSVHNDALLDIVQGDQPPSSMTATVAFGSGFPALQSYAPNYSGPGASTLAGKTFLVYGGAPADLATNVIAYAPGASRTKYAANQSPVGGSYPHWYEVPTLDIAILRLLSAQAGVDSQEDAAFNLDFASGAQRYADSEFDPGQYTYAGGSVHWDLSPGVAAPWAVQGQPEPRTLLAVTQLIDGAGIGLTVNNASSNAFGPNTGFMPAFDLDDADHQAGIFEIEAAIRFTTRSANTISFADGGVIIETRLTGFVFASALRATPEFTVGAFSGVKVAETTIYDGSTVLGVISIRMIRDGSNVAGYSFQYEFGAGAGSQNFAVSATLDIAFLHNDGTTESGITVQEGGTQVGTGAVGTLNFTGAGAEVSESDGIASINVPLGLGERVIHDDSNDVMSISDTERDRNFSNHDFSPAFRLSDNPTGKVYVELTYTIQGSSPVSFVSGEVNRQTSVTFSELASKVRISDNEILSSIDMFSGSSKIGTLNLEIDGGGDVTKSPGKNVSYRIHYDSEGRTSPRTRVRNLGIIAAIKVYFVPEDGGILIEDDSALEGTGHIGCVNFAGDGVSVSLADGTATVTIPGAAQSDLSADDVAVSTDDFDGNLASTDNTVQKVAQKVDDLSVGLSQSQVDARIATWARAGLSRPSAQETSVSASGFDGILATTDNTVQKVAQKLDDLDAADIPVASSGFDGNLASTDNTVQKVAQKLDDLVLSSGGLSQAQVDARINTAIPVARRIPAFSSGDAGKLFRVNSTGTALEKVEISSGIQIVRLFSKAFTFGGTVNNRVSFTTSERAALLAAMKDSDVSGFYVEFASSSLASNPVVYATILWRGPHIVTLPAGNQHLYGTIKAHNPDSSAVLSQFAIHLSVSRLDILSQGINSANFSGSQNLGVYKVT